MNPISAICRALITVNVQENIARKTPMDAAEREAWRDHFALCRREATGLLVRFPAANDAIGVVS